MAYENIFPTCIVQTLEMLKIELRLVYYKIFDRTLDEV